MGEAFRVPQKRSARSEAVRRVITDLYAGSGGASEFAEKLAEGGFYLARGDQRDFVVLDKYANVHSLARRIETADTADLRAFMATIDLAALPSVAEARAAIETNRAFERDLGDVGKTAGTVMRGLSGLPGQTEAKADMALGVATEIFAPIEKAIVAIADLVGELLSPSQPPTKEQVAAKVAAKAEAEKPRQPWEMTPAEQNKWLRDQEARQRNEQLERGVPARQVDDRGERPITRPPDRGRE